MEFGAGLRGFRDEPVLPASALSPWSLPCGLGSRDGNAGPEHAAKHRADRVPGPRRCRGRSVLGVCLSGPKARAGEQPRAPGPEDRLRGPARNTVPVGFLLARFDRLMGLT